MSARCATCRGNGYICFVLRDKCPKISTPIGGTRADA